MLGWLSDLLGKEEGFNSLEYSEFKTKLYGSKKVILVDVRTKPEFDREKLQNAMNVDVNHPNFISRFEGFDKDRPVFVYCQSGKRAKKAARRLAKMGFEDISNLQGGINQWEGKTV